MHLRAPQSPLKAGVEWAAHPVIPVHGRLEQEDHLKLKVSLGDSIRPARAVKQDPVSGQSGVRHRAEVAKEIGLSS